ncbi:Pol, partial [Symbiodinium necroappetens]
MQTELHIVHKGYHHVVHMGKGLRQGCSIAPMIYAAWTCRLCQQLEQRLGAGWPGKHLSVYADDKHGYWTIRSINDLTEARRQLGLLIHTITELGMKVNGAKSRVVLVLKGRLHAQLMKRCTKYWKGHTCLIVNSPAGTMYIPVQPNLEYLGVKLSYGRFEVQAAQHRVQQAHAVFNQLKAPLRINGPLSRRHRLRLYKACVMPSLLYGLVSVGCNMETVKLLSSTISRHLRKVLRIHEKGVSNQAVLQQDVLHNCGYVRALEPSTYFSNFKECKKWVNPVWIPHFSRTYRMLFLTRKNLDNVMAEVILEETKDPPPPPAAEWKQELPPALVNVYFAGNALLAQAISNLTGAQAKDSKAHSRKCPSFFQIADKSNPQYLNYVAPIQRALQGKLIFASSTGITLGSLEATVTLAKKAADKGTALRLQLRAQGDIPIPMPILRTARDLQDIIYHWHQSGQARKLTTAIRFDRPMCMFYGSRVANPILPSLAPSLLVPLYMAGAEENPDATMKETEELELRMFQNYFPAGIDQISTVASEGTLDGSDRGQPTPRLGSGNKGQQRGKGPTPEEEKDPWANWGSAKRGWQQWDQEKQSQINREALREEIRQLKESMFQLQRLALRHEDYLGGFRPETSYAIFMRMGVHASVVPAIFRAQQAWRELKEAEPEKVDKPMRDPKVERLKQDETKEPLPFAKGVATVEAIRLLVS